MGSILWYGEDFDLWNELEKTEYDALIDYSKKNQENIVVQYLADDMSGLQKSMDYGALVLDEFERSAEDDRKLLSILHIGALLGTVRSFEHVLYQKKQQTLAEKSFDPAVYAIKHLDRIVSTLAFHGIMSHKEICDDLELKESTLSEIMKKIQPLNLVNSTKSGKYKLYVLSDEGKIYGEQLQKRKKEQLNEERVLEQLAECILKTQDREHLFEEIRSLIRDKKEYRTNISPGDDLHLYERKGEKYQKEKFSVETVFYAFENNQKKAITLGVKKANGLEDLADNRMRMEV